jgi:hypothetical protein
MDPDLMAVFCEEYTRHMNALAQEHNAAREGAKAELDRVNHDLDRLVQALLDGTPARTVKDRMAQLEARKDVLEAHLAQGEDVKVTMPPSMAGRYREQVAALREALNREDCQAKAAEIMRTLIDKIELTPVCHPLDHLAATWRGYWAWLPKQKGRSGRATLWWSAQNWLRGLALDVISRSWQRTNSNEPYLRSRRIGSPAGRPRATEIDFAPERRRHDGYRFGEDRSASRVHPMNGLHDWYRLERTLGVV